MRVLITGADGQVGRELVDVFVDHDVVACSHGDLDVTEREQVLGAITALKPAAVIHAAAWTAVDACESDPARAFSINAMGVRHVAAGFDITFGKDRTGDPDALKRYGEAQGFSVSIAEAVGDEEVEKFSSSAVRVALKAGRPERAAEILGRPFAIEGPVQHGAKRSGAPLIRGPAF